VSDYTDGAEFDTLRGRLLSKTIQEMRQEAETIDVAQESIIDVLDATS